MAEVLREIQERVPFNNFTGEFRASGISFPESLGGDCVVQSDRLIKALRGGGIHGRVARSDKGRHVAVLGVTGEERYFMDPMLCQDAPILVSGPEGQVVEVGARPIVEGNPTKVLAEVSGQIFTAWTRVYRLSVEQYFDGPKSTYASFCDDLTAGDFSVGEVLSSIVLRLPDEDGSVLILRKEVGSIGSCFAGKVGYKERMVDGEDLFPETEMILERISEKTALDIKEIFRIMNQAAQIMRSRAR